MSNLSKTYIIYAILTLFVAYISFASQKELDNIDLGYDESEAEPLPLNMLLSNLDSEINDVQSFDKTIERFMNNNNIVGASIAVMHNDSLLYAKGFGYANRENNVKTDVNHIFRIASVSKLITAIAIMKLVDEGVINLDDCVFGEYGWLSDSVYRNYRDKRFERITVDNLLRHQGGLTAAFGDPMFSPLDVAKEMNVTPPADRETIIRFVTTKRLRFNPGNSTKYSNVGYAILSLIIEKASGKRYEDYIKENILSPAGCYDMHIGHSLDRYPNEVQYYEPGMDSVAAFDGSGKMVLRSCGGNYIEALSGAGAWVASPTELLKLLAVVDGLPTIKDILPDSLIHLMSQRGEHSELPLGWMTSDNKGTWSRSGTFAGTNAMLRREANGYAWAIITNTSRWDGPRFTRSLITLMSQAMRRVKNWPERDMFKLQEERQSLHSSDTIYSRK